MKCEIIDGQLVVQPTTATEKWAFSQWIESQSSWGNVRNCVRLAGSPKDSATSTAAADASDDELDMIFGSMPPAE